MNITAIIMASGYARRMGENKLLLTYKGKTFIQHTMEIVQNCNFFSRIIVARQESVLILAKNLGFKGVKNKNSNKGQSESIKLGIDNAPISDGYMFFTVDQPLLDSETINFLLDTFQENSRSIIIPKFHERRGSPVVFPFKFLQELKELQGDTGGKQVINNHKEDIVFAEVSKGEVLIDIDTLEDYYNLKLGYNLDADK